MATSKTTSHSETHGPSDDRPLSPFLAEPLDEILGKARAVAALLSTDPGSEPVGKSAASVCCDLIEAARLKLAGLVYDSGSGK